MSDRTNVLHTAIELGHSTTVERLLRREDMNVNDCTLNGVTALQASLRNGNKFLTGLLVDHGADVNVRCHKTGDAPLHEASAKGDDGNCEMMIEKGAEVNAKNHKGQTPLFLAASAKLATVLLQNGADIHARDLMGDSPLHVTSVDDRLVVVDILVRYGADVNATNDKLQTPLHLACKNPCSYVICYLMMMGADINMRDDANETPLIRFYSQANPGDYLALFYHRAIYPHIIKMTKCNLFVCDEIMEKVHEAERLNVLEPAFVAEINQRCHEEVDKLKRIKINTTNVSYFDFMTKTPKARRLFLKNESILNASRADLVDCTTFPLYGQFVKSMFRKAIIRNGLVAQGYPVFESMCDGLPYLPRHCIEQILGNLSDQDLRTMIAASKPIVQPPTEDFSMKKVQQYKTLLFSDFQTLIKI